MGRVFLHGMLLVALFFGVYETLRKVDWLTVFEVNKNLDKTEKKLGDLLWKMFRESDEVVSNPKVVNRIDSIVTRICEHNEIAKDKIKLHVLEKEEVNAFALPDGHLVVYSGLIAASESPEELAGVIGHELAHIQLDHVMKKLVKEVGLSVLISATAGGGGEVPGKIVRTLSSSAFDRKQEREADLHAVDYLIAAKIDPVPFGEFLYRIGGKAETASYLSWLSTHPDSRERGEYIVEYAGEQSFESEQLLSPVSWTELKSLLHNDR